MPGLTDVQIDWIKTFPGMHVAPPQDESPAPVGKPSISAKGFADRFMSKAGKKPVPPPLPADEVLAGKLKQLEDAIAAVKAKKFDVARMQSDLDDLKTKAANAEKQADEKKKATALGALNKRADEEIRHTAALAKSIKDAMGDKDDAPTDDQRSKVYQNAIKSLYKLDFDIPKDMKNTHFDRVFDMMGTLPEGDVKHDQLKHLVYNKKDIGGVYYGGNYVDKDKDGKVIKKYKAGSIEMGDFGDASKEEGYEIEGEKLQANSFDVTTLHEIGHSVDQKHGIMSKHQKDNGCGNWQDETPAKVAAAYLAELRSKKTLPDTVKDPSLLKVINIALAEGTVTQPDDITDDAAWQDIADFITKECFPMREDANPFFKSTPVVVNKRVYTQSGGAWYSYAMASRTATLVNNYQWRAPAEWFAEVYAITWLKKKKPPSLVPADVAKHCWME